MPNVSADYLVDGGWQPLTSGFLATTKSYQLGQVPEPAVVEPDLTPDEPYSTTTRAGFVRLKLSGGFGTDTYPVALATWIKSGSGDAPKAPVLPTMGSLAVDYTAQQQLNLSAPSEAGGRYLHIAPFGYAEQSLASGAASVPCFPSRPVPARRKASSTSACATCTRRRTSRCCSRSSTAPPTRSS